MSQAILQAKLWYAQRISAMILGLCVSIHLVIIFYAIRGGLTAEEILGRTQGNIAFAIFYEIFVLACFVHAPIGLANILEETLSKGFVSKTLSSILAVLILILGTAAVIGVYTGGAL
ncbi:MULTISPECIES: succinate dehydrogenase [unclassified Polynucleobacter]|jgi:fumarate reductase subunit C|uniref:succinate dehydrogenase n=1 Tax=unclassified Polynucleobacter TaxID=2640945 RepID=UPI000BD92AE4|nr:MULTISPECIES: succinate dehydrogenase [unclassified Polynucleobacter]OYY17241.1 MAG: succinate dehydrogenase [Polynucleobacter sp. 35-46-11]OZA75594.1 MAG: succinate dehydrogenase [Polynucleobacter sp. 39-46-10]